MGRGAAGAALLASASRPTCNQAVAQAGAAAEQYIAEYNIWMHHLVDDDGRAGSSRPSMRLLSHWNLRDEIKADYADGQDGPRHASAPSPR